MMDDLCVCDCLGLELPNNRPRKSLYADFFVAKNRTAFSVCLLLILSFVSIELKMVRIVPTDAVFDELPNKHNFELLTLAQRWRLCLKMEGLHLSMPADKPLGGLIVSIDVDGIPMAVDFRLSHEGNPLTRHVIMQQCANQTEVVEVIRKWISVLPVKLVVVHKDETNSFS
jgi:hypothetical protein